MPDYAAECARFDWAGEKSRLAGLPGGGLNMAYEALDRQIAAGRGGLLAVRFIDREGRRTDLTFEDLARATNRFANMLRGLGLGRGARVFGLLGRSPALHIAALGTMKAGMVFCPMFSAFGPEPVRTRLELGETGRSWRPRRSTPARVAFARAIAELRHVPSPARAIRCRKARSTSTPCLPASAEADIAKRTPRHRSCISRAARRAPTGSCMRGRARASRYRRLALDLKAEDPTGARPTRAG
jgi:non-ribosomal peptide synthetase component F